MTERVGFYGGSFDPPHVAHVLAAVYALAVAGLDRLLVVPVSAHAFEKRLAPFSHRMQMCRLAMGDLPRVVVSDVEQGLGAPSRTLRSVEHLADAHPDWQLRLIVGSDVLDEAHEWHAFPELVAKAPLFVVGRGGTARGEAPLLPAISSTHVRELLRAGASARQELSGLVPAAVLRYIDEHGLYR